MYICCNLLRSQYTGYILIDLHIFKKPWDQSYSKFHADFYKGDDYNTGHFFDRVVLLRSFTR